MVVKVAKATVTRTRERPKDVAKAKGKAKEDNAQALTRRIGTRTRKGPGETPTLR